MPRVRSVGRRVRLRAPYTLNSSAGGGGAFEDASFAVPFGDSGSGAVNLTVRRSLGSGTPTFTRATAAAARTGVFAAGVGYVWNLGVASGTARSHYDPNGNYLGYLSEGAASQLITNTRDLSQAAWVKVNMTAALTSTGLENAGSSCSRVTCVVGADTILQTVVAAASTRTFSAFVKRVTGTGTVTMNHGTSSLDITALINSSTFTLVQLSASELNATLGFTITTAADAIDVDCAQFEAGDFATTPIPAAGTRNADVLTYVFAGNASASQGSASCKIFSIPTLSTGGVRSAVSFAAGSNGPCYMQTTDLPTVCKTADGSNVVSKSSLSNCSTFPRTTVSAWGGTTAGQAITADGLAVTTGTFDGAMGSTSIAIGNDGGGTAPFYGCIQSVSIWATRFENSALQTLSQT